MAKLKGVKKLNKEMTEIFRISDDDIQLKLADIYSYIFEKNVITFTIQETFEDKLFNDFILERFDYKVKYPFVITILHELGHHFNNDEIEGSIYDFCISEKERIEKEIFETNDDDRVKALNYQYFGLPDEIMASAWAVEWARHHKKQVKEMNKKVMKALNDFYEKNNVTEQAEGGEQMFATWLEQTFDKNFLKKC